MAGRDGRPYLTAPIVTTGRAGACYAPRVRRLALSIVALLLTFGLSGVASLVAAEPCSSLASGTADSDCPPACVTCGCCHQASDVTVAVPALSPTTRPRPRLEIMPTTSDRAPRGILHVPRAA
jgi:hypothetical protein